MIEHVSVSELRTFLRCRREHAHLYTLGIAPVKEEQPFVFGKLIHSALEAWWRNAGDERLGAAFRAIDEALHKTPNLVDAYDRVRAEEMIRAYHGRWADDELAVIEVEQDFRAPLVHPITGEVSRRAALSGRVDAIARDRRGNVWILEHKTARDAGPGPYWERLRMDLQCSVYMIGVRALGFDPTGIVFDVIEKPSLKPLQPSIRRNQLEPESPEAFRTRLAADHAIQSPCTRGAIVHLEADEREAALDIWWAAHELVEQKTRTRERNERAPRTPDACFRYGRMCPYFGPCTNSANIHDEGLFKRSSCSGDDAEERS